MTALGAESMAEGHQRSGQMRSGQIPIRSGHKKGWHCVVVRLERFCHCTVEQKPGRFEISNYTLSHELGSK